jgi:hypothetical protein
MMLDEEWMNTRSKHCVDGAFVFSCTKTSMIAFVKISTYNDVFTCSGRDRCISPLIFDNNRHQPNKNKNAVEIAMLKNKNCHEQRRK